ncbi:MAG: V-type ATP synthase subunit F [Candidatus Heimdallarchaeota archaeon]|nr:hypothetical protein [Candidatus Heimdallarchaeota archaeon]MCG3254935.1 V-type ATP synthase subunit F [Candidatus Heimdallarchaeota archaeon]MCK4610010.1 V-type ATP synthase subunit F [Candidatus Heimdallarchaeota archaeon]
MSDLESSKKAFVIGARETVRGFNLIGVPGQEVFTPKETLEKLEEALQKDYTLVIISASVIIGVEETIEQIRLENATPIIVLSDVNVKIDPKELETKFRKFIGY